MIAEAEELYRRGDYDGAKAKTLLAADDCAASLRIRGLCCIRQGAPQDGLRLLQRAHALAPDDPWTALHLGIGWQANGGHIEAIRCFRIAQAGLPGDPAPSLNLASSALVLGDLTLASRAARQARLWGPKLPQVHYVLGQVHHARGNHADAARSFTKAVLLAPGFVDAWLNLGVSRYNLGSMEGAKGALRRVLSLAPYHRSAIANLAVFLRLTGHWKAAEVMLSELLARDPEAHAARLNMAAYLLHDGLADDAWALLDRPLPNDPAIRTHWRLQQCMAAIQLNRSDAARSILAEVATDDAAAMPLLAWRQALLAQLEGNAAGARAAAVQAERALRQDVDMVPEHRIMSHHDLARFWSSADETDRAFSHWTAAHGLLATFQPFSRARFAAFVEAVETRFTRDRLWNGARAGNSDDAPVFIVGMPRSGTTLAEQILSAHPDIFGAGERPDMEAIFHRLGGAMESADAVAHLAALDVRELNEAASAYLSNLHALAPTAARIVDKMPANFRLLGLIGLMLPKARVIWCLRDPRDIGLSIYSLRFYGHHPYAHDLADLGWYITQQYRLLRHWQAVLPNPILPIRLTDWIDDFTGTLRHTLDFLGLPYDPACERFHAQDRRVHTASRWQVREPVNARGIGRWRGYEAQLAPLIASLETDDLHLHGSDP